ncbi:hypothetical protein Taro_007600, partial [Colocasia esculenta]|nr:hypothetical protein [Colocasia esculenta]
VFEVGKLRGYSRGFSVISRPPRIFGHILTSRGFRPYLDIYSCHLSACLGFSAICWRFLRTSNVVGFKSHPRERTPLHRSGVGPAPSGWTKGTNCWAIFCHFPLQGRIFNSLDIRGILILFRRAGVFLQFSKIAG